MFLCYWRKGSVFFFLTLVNFTDLVYIDSMQLSLNYLYEKPIDRYLFTVNTYYLVFCLLCLFQCFRMMPRVLLKRKGLFRCCQVKCADFCFIQESYACSEDALFWKNQYGSDVWFSFGTNQQGLQC